MTLLEVYRTALNLEFDLRFELFTLVSNRILVIQPDMNEYNSLLKDADFMDDETLAFGIEEVLSTCVELRSKLLSAKDISVTKQMRQMERLYAIAKILPDDDGVYAQFETDAKKFISETTHNIVTGNKQQP